ncbi:MULTISPECIES: TetR/AcrR family transcriptional regulator [Actinomadura]|uniref:TetR/AcrR family transcriptional regulator n=1 Tax=Actinomadura TaxID=1988 RepID=UPI000408A8FB|nr:MULTISPECIES: TetR/AcrR family transcriptional regulator [Actinomadura]RSN60019.1 TetR family transcriptional regulator [Actinomadura sp. WAC 06369]
MTTERRRTQRERREGTIGRLLDATIAAISEVGYARASVGEICTRAGVSRGGLFRHFDTRLDLLVAAAEEVGRRQLALVGEQLAAHPDAGLRDALELMRGRHRAVDNVVWFELLVAARTDAELRARLAPAAERYRDAITELARAAPGLRDLPDEDRHVLVSAARHLFDGETIHRTVVPEPDAERRRLELLAELAETVLRRRAPRP